MGINWLGRHLSILHDTDRRRLLIYAVGLVLLAVAFPIGLSIYFAEHEAISVEKQRAVSYARDALGRTEATMEQINNAFERMRMLPGADPCSEQHLALMRQLDLASSYIQAIGVEQDNRLVCSSLGSEVSGVDLGPVDIVQPNGLRLRMDVVFPFAPGNRFIAVEQDGLVAIVHKALPVDVISDVGGLNLAIASTLNGRLITARGELDPRWLQAARGGPPVWIEDGHVLARVSSEKYFLESVCALPVGQVRLRVARYARVLVPVGLIVGLLLGTAAFFLVRKGTSMRNVLKSALRRNEFFVEYQPVVDLVSGRWTGAEVLVRWRRARGELVRPDVFVPVIEEHGLSRLISGRVVQLVGREAFDLFRMYPDFQLAINLTADDLHDYATVEIFSRLCAATGARPGNLAVEITERCLTNASAANQVIRAFRHRGIEVAIDDFGTGYSSLSYLESLEIDAIKIDKSFVDTVQTAAPTSQVVTYIIQMGKSLGKRMIAEGVEKPNQAAYLRQHGVQSAQGWLYSMPLDYPGLLSGLRQNRMRLAAEEASRAGQGSVHSIYR